MLSSAIKCYQVLLSAIKCYQVLSNVVLWRKTKEKHIFALKKQHYVCIRIKKTVEKFVGEKLSINYSKKQKNEQYIVLDSAIKCYHMLPSAIKCYQMLCFEEKLKKNIFLLWKRQHYVWIRIKKNFRIKIKHLCSKRQKIEQFLVLDSYEVLPSAIKCYKVLPSVIKCCVL